MCAFSVAADARPALRAGRLKSIVISGLATAAASLIGFGLAHAFIITPIWNRLLGGAPFALVGGLALAAAFDQLPQRLVHSPWRMGVAFGAVMFLALVPATALDTALRLTGLRRANNFETTIALVLAAACGSIAGWLWTHRRNAAIAFGAASTGLMIATAGPLPVAQSEAGLWLSFAIAPICLVAGIVLALTQRVVQPHTP